MTCSTNCSRAARASWRSSAKRSCCSAVSQCCDGACCRNRSIATPRYVPYTAPQRKTAKARYATKNPGSPKAATSQLKGQPAATGFDTKKKLVPRRGLIARAAAPQATVAAITNHTPCGCGTYSPPTSTQSAQAKTSACSTKPQSEARLHAGQYQCAQAASEAPAKQQVSKARTHAGAGRGRITHRHKLAEVANVKRPKERLKHANPQVPQALGQDDGNRQARKHARERKPLSREALALPWEAQVPREGEGHDDGGKRE